MRTDQATRQLIGRPDYMAVLGLLPPYTVADVKQAYLAKAKTAHPDTGGDEACFVCVQRAYERADRCVRARGSRTAWIRSHVDHYLQLNRVAEEVRLLGGSVDVQRLDWPDCSLGADFAQLADRLVSIHFHNVGRADQAVDYLLGVKAALHDVRLLDFAGSNIGDSALPRLPPLHGLRQLDLRSTPISGRGLLALPELPHLERLNVDAKLLGAQHRWKLRRRFPNLRIVASSTFGPAPGRVSSRLLRQWRDDDALRRVRTVMQRVHSLGPAG